MLKTVVLLNIFVETTMCFFFFQDSLLNKKFEQTAFWNGNLF